MQKNTPSNPLDLAETSQIEVLNTAQEADCLARPLSTLDRQLAEKASALFAALADPTRLSILKLLLDNHGEACVCDIASNFHLGQPTISHHLKILRDAQLVCTNKRGKWVFYTLEKTHLEQIKQFFTALFILPGSSQE